MRQTTRIYTYTLYREPEHQVLLDHVSGRACSAWMQEHEFDLWMMRWDHLKERLLTGEIPGYQLTMHSLYFDKPARRVSEPMPAQVRSPEINTPPPLCGYCAKWTRLDRGRVNGLRMGVCEATGRATERCHRCDAEKGVE